MFFGKHTLDKFTLEFQMHSKYTPGFHKIVFDVRIVSFAECLSRDLDDYVENTFAIVSNYPHVRSDSIIPVEQCSFLASETIGNDCLATAKF